MVKEYAEASQDGKKQLIFKLRQETCQGLMACKRALTECDSWESAKTYLCKRGVPFL